MTMLSGTFFFTVFAVGGITNAINILVKACTAICLDFVFGITFRERYSLEMIARKFLRGMLPGLPDSVHFHALVYKRLVKNL